jgi:diacylglycerol kinase (ATP)
VRVLVNPKSGLGFSFDSFWGIVEEQFGPFGADVSYQFSRDVADGRRKAEGAVRDGVDALIVVGGDGMVNSIGSALVGTPVALESCPPAAATASPAIRHSARPARRRPGLARSRRRAIDVGAANGRPFFVTCSLAWDAAIVRGFEAFPSAASCPTCSPPRPN